MSYKKEMIRELSADIKKAGFRVFIAASGEYGFYTDAEGSRIVSFGVDLLSVRYSGNYVTNMPRNTGTGWRIGENLTEFAAAFNYCAPSWAVGTAKWKYTTLAEYLKSYQASSKFEEAL